MYNMEVAENKVVYLIYELRRDNSEGEVVETLAKENPLSFLFGKGSLLAKFEDNIQGLKEGDKFSFKLSSDEAYGPMEDNAIVDVPIMAFEVDGKVDYKLVKTGNSIPMVDRDGKRLNGIIREIGAEHVKMDFNHPMAGANLFFSGEITGIREASEDELSHGHVHSAGSCHSCEHDNCGGHC
jgi:FKBP-type peptidyl-prolyl cis-trans isomerase SlyD